MFKTGSPEEERRWAAESDILARFTWHLPQDTGRPWRAAGNPKGPSRDAEALKVDRELGSL